MVIIVHKSYDGKPKFQDYRVMEPVILRMHYNIATSAICERAFLHVFSMLLDNQTAAVFLLAYNPHSFAKQKGPSHTQSIFVAAHISMSGLAGPHHLLDFLKNGCRAGVVSKALAEVLVLASAISIKDPHTTKLEAISLQVTLGATLSSRLTGLQGLFGKQSQKATLLGAQCLVDVLLPVHQKVALPVPSSVELPKAEHLVPQCD